MTESQIELISELIVSVAQDKQGERITVVKLSKPIFVDQVILLTAKNNIHMKSIAEYIAVEYKKKIQELNSPDFFESPHLNGTVESGWMLLDCNSIIVHILLENVRDFYDLDGLYEKRGILYHF